MAAVHAVRMRAIAVIATLAVLLTTLGGVLGRPANATAPEPGIAQLKTTLARVADWTEGMATVGKLAEPIPTIGSSAGAVLGFPDLVRKAVVEQLDTVQHWAELGSREVTLGDGREVTLTLAHSETDGDHAVSVRLQATKTVSDAPFTFAHETPKVNLSSSGGMTVTGEVDLQFQVVVDQTSPGVYVPYVVRSASSPSLAVDVTADLPDGASLAASVGILGVTATAVGDATASIHLVGTVDDPDGDGRLYGTRADGTAGELADPTAAIGLWTVGFRGTEAGGAGSVAMRLGLTATATASMSLPSVNGEVVITWADISTGTPTVTTSGLDPVDAFLRLSPRDLADMLGQLASFLTGSQRADERNLELPFLSGSLADAVKAGEALVDFIEKNVVQPPAGGSNDTVDPARIGEPSFRSIQQLVEELEGYTGGTELPGADMSVVVGNLAAGRLPIDLTISRAAPAAVDLVTSEIAVSGTATSYTATGFTHTGETFAETLVGSRVTAGTSGGTIASVAGDTVTLAGAWVGGTPPGGSVYVVSGAEVDAGAIELANLLGSDGKAIANANAVVPTAKVTPDYIARLKFALDLSEPRTGEACVGPTGTDAGNTVTCPYAVPNLDGTETVITEEPLPVDRLLIGTDYDMLVADFPMEATAQVNARAGFLAVQVNGTVEVCATGAAADCANPTAGDPMVKLTLNSVGDEPEGGYVRVADMFRSLVRQGDQPSQAADRLTFDTNVRGYASGDVTVPDAEQFLPGGATAGFTATWADVGTGAPTVTATDLSEILAFDIDPTDPMALLGVVLRALQVLDEQLQADGGPGVLSQEIPVVDTSLRELLGQDESGGGPTVSYSTVTVGTGDAAKQVTKLTDTSRTGDRAFDAALAGRSIVLGTQVGIVAADGVTGTSLTLTSALTSQPANGTPYFLRSELADAISLLTAAPPDTMQQLVKVLDDRLGGDYVRFAYKQLGAQPNVVVDFDWNRSYSTSTPVQFDLGGNTLAGAKGDGTAQITVSADVDVDLAVPLALPATVTDVVPKVLDTSNVSVDARASVEGVLEASVGPLGVSLGSPSDPATANARYRVGLAGDGSGDAVDFGTFLTSAGLQVNQYTGGVTCDATTGNELALCADFPLYVSTDGTSYEPLFPKAGEPTVPDPGKGSLQVRLPKAAGSGTPEQQAETLFRLSGTVSGTDSRPRVSAPTPADLAAAFEAALLDFGMIGDGIDALLALLEDALRAASMEGKLPLVGEDLQAGSDFLGDVRTELTALFDQIDTATGGRIPTADAVNDYLGTEFTAALTRAGANPPGDFAPAITCLLQPVDVKAVTAEGDTTGDATEYTYAVVAVGSSSGSPIDTGRGELATVSRGGTLGADLENVVTWDARSNAVGGYKILRSTDGGTAWTLVATAPAGATSFADAGGGTAYDGQPGTDPVTVDVCTGVPIQDIEGVKLVLDIGAGTTSADQGCVDGPTDCYAEQIPLDIGVPGLAIRPAREGSGDGLSARVGWRLHLAIELDKETGLSLLTKDQALPEFGVGLNVDLSGPLQAELAFLKVDVTKNGTLPAFAAAFQVDLKSGADEVTCWDSTCAGDVDPDRRLGLAELSSAETYSDLVVARLDLNLQVDWLLKATVDAAFPGIQADLYMDWHQSIDSAQPDAAELAGFEVGFRNVQIDVGKFLGEVLGPIVTEIKKITGPVQPVVDTLYAPIPVLSDLSRLAGGPDVTLVTLAKMFSTLADGPDLTFVDTVAAVITFVNNIPTPNVSGAELLLPIGEFFLEPLQAWNVEVTPDTGRKIIKQSSKKYTKRDATTGQANGTTTDETEANVKSGVDAKSNKPALTKPDASGKPVATGAGFAFPLLDNPGQIFNLIMGGDVDIVTFDSGALGLAFVWRQAFGPVYAPPPVFITMSGAASVTAQIHAGFDTYGLRKAFEEDTLGGAAFAVLDGLYLKSTDDVGSPLPVITLYGEIAAGAAVSAVVITVGVEGGVSLTINLAWNDPNNDGRFRLFEFGQVALNNPICLFQMSGRIGLFLRVYITLGVSPFSVSFDFTLADITLLDFSVRPNCDPPPPRLGGVTDDTLVVFAGKLGTGDIRGNAAWDNREESYGQEIVKVTQLHDFTNPAAPAKKGVKVDMLGISETWTNPGINRVVVDGRDYAKPMKVTFMGDGDQSRTSGDAEIVPTGGFSMEAVVLGGTQSDVITAGTGRALIAGGGEKDVISASSAPGAGDASFIAGGAGDDSVSTGNRDAVAAGDSDLTGGNGYEDHGTLTLTRADGASPASVTVGGAVNWAALAAPSAGETSTDGKDRVALGRGSNTGYGNGGDDSVSVAADSELARVNPDPALRAGANTIVLGTGSDSAKGGTGDDTIWTGPQTAQTRAAADVDGTGGADSGVRNTVDTGPGNDTVFGSTIADHVTGGSTPSQKLVATGGDGQDVLLGGLGSDELFGGPGKDWVVAEPATVGDSDGTAVDDLGTLTRTYAKSALPAGTSPSGKLLVGGDHEDRVIGGDGASVLFGDRFEADACGTPVGTPQSTQPVEPAAGTPGRDLITGGAGIDKVKAGGLGDRATTYGGDDLVCGQGGDDELFTGNGADTVWAGSGNDRAYSEADADRVYGNDGDDALYGADGADVIEGNDGSDRAYGGTQDDRVLGGSQVAGVPDTGGDELYGDAGADTLIGDNGNGSIPFDLDGAVPAAGGPDRIFGGADADRGFGGLGDDTVRGGDGDDHLEGNNAADHVAGEAGEDELVGGSSQAASAGVGRPDGDDTLEGGDGNDVLAGDNAQVLAGEPHPLTAGRGFTTDHAVTLLDLGYAPTGGTSGTDTISGGNGSDVALGQGGDDTVAGGPGDDYAEGGPGADTVTGDGGQDDLVGGSYTPLSAGTGQPDAGDEVSGGSESDVVLGDNGSVLRTGTVHPLVAGRGITDRSIAPYDVAVAPQAGSSGPDVVRGEDAVDVLLGQGGDDDVAGGAGDDYAEGGSGADTVNGDGGQDDLVGGSYTPLSAGTGQPDAGDDVFGGSESDVALGDNGALLRTGDEHPLVTGRGITKRSIAPYDVQDAAPAASSGPDIVEGQDGTDVLLGQGGDDRVKGGLGEDYAEGGQGGDWVEGNWDDDDLVGGSYTPSTGSGTGLLDAADVIHGGDGDDVATGDNGQVLRGAGRTKATDRLGSSGGLMTERKVTLLDLGASLLVEPAGRFGGDQISGGDDVDVLWGQDGPDAISGGNDDDYAEGNGAGDQVRGDIALDVASPHLVAVPALPGAWRGEASAPADLTGTATDRPGQDDLIGGSSVVGGFRDGGDVVEGDARADVVLGDNGTLARVVQGADEQRYDERYGSSTPTADRTKVRVLDDAISPVSTRFCTTAQATCEVAGAFGADILYGDGGDDGIWAQDGDDTVRGGDDRDDLFGELGNDKIFGEAGEDAILGDRGGIRNELLTADDPVFPITLSSVPQDTHTAMRAGQYDRRVDQHHDTNGSVWLGGSSDPAMAHPGLPVLGANARPGSGGNDQIRGGPGDDQIHAGVGDDVANGDSGGDEVFGGDGADVLWGGKGCEVALAECLSPADRGAGNRYVDHVFGGVGGDRSGGILGADFLDWAPRSTYATCTPQAWTVDNADGTSSDPCLWYEMTDMHDADPANNQHHQGTDWMYGGWDRDVMQGDVAGNGPNEGDRLIDWNGTFNLYSHCNAAYGGFNDVRQHSPAMQTYLHTWAWGSGAGRAYADASKPGTSAFRDLALTYTSDLKEDHGTGKPFPGTPGHFDAPVACAP